MGKTSTQETSQTIDPSLMKQGIRNQNLVAGLAGMGWSPFMGNMIAAVQPAQQAAMNMSNIFADAFGFEGQAGVGLPEATDDGSGIMGYSPFDQMRSAMGDGYDDMMAQMDQWYKQASKKQKYKKQKTAGGGKGK